MSNPRKRNRRAPPPPQQAAPTPAEIVAEADAPFAAPVLPLVQFAPCLAALAAECPPLANAVAAEYAAAAQLAPEAAALYVPPSVSELARRAGVARSTARRLILRARLESFGRGEK